MIQTIESLFFYLVQRAQNEIGDDSLNLLLEKPDSIGQTVFLLASIWSERIARFILKRPIAINFLDSKMMGPKFQFKDLITDMLQKDINPFIMDFTGASQYDEYEPYFADIEPKLLDKFRVTGNAEPGFALDSATAVYYVLHDWVCPMNCNPIDSCPEYLQKFAPKVGVRSTKTKSAGKGGQGTVYFDTWHDHPAAFKYFLLETTVPRTQTTREETGIPPGMDTNIADLQQQAQRTMDEYLTLLKLKHSNIVQVYSCYRQQIRVILVFQIL